MRTTFATAYGSTFNLYFKGKVEAPAMHDLPMFTIFQVSTEQKKSGTLRDNAIFTIGIEIFVNIRQYFDNSAGQGTQLDTLDALVDFVEQRDSNGIALTTTVIGILNANLTAGSRVLYLDNFRANYLQYVNQNNSLIGKAEVTFEAHDRPSRVV